jgi:hypothetical protein
MPLTIFDVKGVPGNRRERIEAAVVLTADLATAGSAEEQRRRGRSSEF